MAINDRAFRIKTSSCIIRETGPGARIKREAPDKRLRCVRQFAFVDERETGVESGRATRWLLIVIINGIMT